MHREISHADRAFGHESRLSLYLLTWLLGFIVLADLWPYIVRILGSWAASLPTWSNDISGYRLALIAALIGGARVLYGALDGMLQGKFGADIALAIAVVAAILLREPLVAAEIVFVGLLGECLEDYTFSRTKAAVRKLAELTPMRCWRLRDGVEERVLVADLAVDDVVVVKPGAKVPADGVVVAGASAVDVSALTGESLPSDKAVGDEILAGSLNGQGALTIKVRRVAQHTVVGQVVQMTAQAMQEKAPLERSVDRMARYFLPVVLILAAVTFLVAGGIHYSAGNRAGLAASFRYAAYPALSVLVVACPCALILATPAAIIAALGRLAGTGVLIKGGGAVERLAQVDSFAFDKTGTLTEGRIEIAEVVPLGTYSAQEVLRLAASAERLSEHPLAQALVASVDRGVDTPRSPTVPLMEATDFLAHAGSGVSATVGNAKVLVGNRRLMATNGVVLGEDIETVLTRLEQSGQTTLLVAVDGAVVGAIGARDRLRQEAREIIEELRRLGISRVVMLTGDRAAAAKPVAEEVHILDVHAELLPTDKAKIVSEMPGRVAFVGDGVNDAPALARSHVGLAIGGTGIDVAADAGDVVLMLGPSDSVGERPRSPLRHLPLLLRLSRETVRIIRQNIIVFAFGVNLVGVVLTSWLWPFLAPGYVDQGPLAAVLYHQIGSLLVLINSMRLLWFERQGVTTWLDGWNHRLDTRFDIDEALHTASHFWREIIGGAVLCLLAIWFYSGLHAVGPDEVGIVRRFGRVLPIAMESGLNIRWPWPIEVVDRVRLGQMRTVELGYRSGVAGVRQAGRSWSAEHGSTRDAEEAVVMTGDGSLLEIQASVLYTVAQPAIYLFDVARPDAAIRDAAESVVRETASGQSMAWLLTNGRAAFQIEVSRRLKERLSALHPYSLGVKLEGFALHDVHPPTEVVQSYHEVARSRQRRDQLVNQAKAGSIVLKRRQESENLQAIRRAEAERHERIALAEARRAEFTARLQARGLSWSDELELFIAFLSGALDVQAYATARNTRAEANAALTDFRIYWESLSSSLAGRPKFLIDSDRLPGRRTLWLVPPPAPFFSARPSRPATVPGGSPSSAPSSPDTTLLPEEPNP